MRTKLEASNQKEQNSFKYKDNTKPNFTASHPIAGLPYPLSTDSLQNRLDISSDSFKNQTANLKEPLKDSSVARVTFKGSFNSAKIADLARKAGSSLVKNFTRRVEDPQTLYDFMIGNPEKYNIPEDLKLAVEKAFKTYTKYRQDPIKLVTEPVYVNVGKAFIDPILLVYNTGKKLGVSTVNLFEKMSGKNTVITEETKRKELKQADSMMAIIKDLKEYIEDETKKINRKKTKKPKLDVDKEVKNIAIKYKNKALTKFLPRLNTQVSSALSRLNSGFVTALANAVDFFNLISYSTGDEKKAKNEFKERFKQDMLYVSLSAYVGYVANAMFKKLANNNPAFIFGLNIAIGVGTAILSRKMMGRPILPISDEKAAKLDASNKDEKYKKALDEKTPYAAFTSNDQTEGILDKIGFSSNNNLPGKKLSFTGLPGKPGEFKKIIQVSLKKVLVDPKTKIISFIPEWLINKTMKMDEFNNMMNLLEKVDPDVHQDVLLRAAVLNGIPVKEKKIDSTNGVEIVARNFDEVRGELASKLNKKYAPIDRNIFAKIVARIFDIVVMPLKLLGMFGIFCAKKGIELYKLISSKIQRKPYTYPDELKKDPKENLIIVNTFKLLEESAHKANIYAYKVNTEKLSDEKLTEIRLNFGESISQVFSSKFSKPEGHLISTLMKLAGAFTAVFGAFDAYNSTKLATKDNNLAAQKGKERAVQDYTRQGVSTWLVAAYNSLFREIYNHSFLGTFFVVVSNSASYEILTRKALGMPILPKSREEYIKMEQKNAKKTGGFHRFMMRISGKKPLQSDMVAQENSSNNNINLGIKSDRVLEKYLVQNRFELAKASKKPELTFSERFGVKINQN